LLDEGDIRGNGEHGLGQEYDSVPGGNGGSLP